jgi:ArsR family transcriptional regulator, arsenate/arsenite/antimonite-responsive transcriptional repressor
MIRKDKPITKMISDPELVEVLSALGHAVRLSLWRLLLPHGSNGLPAGDIADQMSLVPSSLSFHLRQMTEAGVLVQRRRSRNVVYAVNFGVLDTALQALLT